MRRVFGLAIALLLSVISAIAQNVSCSLNGVVQDAVSAVVPAAEVKLVLRDTGFTRTSRTNQEGFFSFPDLQPGAYDFTVVAPGFKTYRQSGLELSTGDQRSTGVVKLELGEVTESISVVADANPVMLSSGERADVLTNNDIQGVALRGRDFMDAVGLLPGIVDTSDSREAPSSGSIGGIFILGGRSTQKNMTVDGVSNMDTGSNGTLHTTPSMSAIGEVKVLMSNYSAEYGRNSGGNITIITRGGTRDFRVSAGWYHRHESYAANDYFNNEKGLQKPPYRYNIFDYTVGGPVYIPGKFNRDRSRLFFFFSQEMQRQKVNYGTRTVRVPTELERAGDFSRSYDVNGRVIPVYDPANGQRAFPGNVIPADRFNATGLNILKLFPLPNFVDPAPSRVHQWNYISSLSGAFPRHTEIARVDYSPKANLMMYVRITNTGETQHAPYGSWFTNPLNFPLSGTNYSCPGRGAVLRATFTASPTMFLESMFGASYNRLTFYPENPERIRRADTGIAVPQWYPNNNPLGLLPNMTFASVPNFANPGMHNSVPYYNTNPLFTWTETMSKVAGTHTMKFGFYWERVRKDTPAVNGARGVLSFNRDRNSPLDTNYAYATALLGNFTNYSEASAQPRAQFRYTNLEWFAQDSWRVSSRLTLEYGLRFYHQTPEYDARKQLSSFVPSLYDPAKAPVLLRPGFNASGARVAVDPLTGAAFPDVYVGTYVPGVGDPAIGMRVGGIDDFPLAMHTVPSVLVAPRFGFAFDPFGRQRTALRGGFGVSYDRISTNPTLNELGNPPIVYVPVVYYGTMNGLNEAANRKVLGPNASLNSLFGHHSPPTAYNFSFGVQHQFWSNILADVSYVGSLGRHLLWRRNINPVPAGANHLDKNPQNIDPTNPTRPLPPNFLRPYQGLGDVMLGEFASNSNYHSLQASLNRRLSRGVMFGAAYTFSKALGTASGDGENVSPFFPTRQREYGPLTFDRTHIFSLRYNWTLPRPGRALGQRFIAVVTDGWEIAGIGRVQSGATFTPGFTLVSGMDVSGTPSEGARIDVRDPAAPPAQRFGPPARGTFGNAGVGILTLPGMNNWDASLYRRIRLDEKRYLQLRFETYNTLNHTQFSNVQRQARFDATGAQVDPTFLEPTAARSARRIQLALRLQW